MDHWVQGGLPLSEMSREDLLKIEAIGSEWGRVSSLAQEDKEHFAYLCTVFKRYNIVPSRRFDRSKIL